MRRRRSMRFGNNTDEKYVVEITESALRDMSDLYDYIADTLGSIINAGNQYDRIADEILTLDTFPERYPVLSSALGWQLDLRRMLVESFSVFYVVRGDYVIVTDALYSASDIERRLDGRRGDLKGF